MKKRNLFQKAVAAVLFVSLAFAVAGCSKQKKETDPRAGGSVTVGITQEPGIFDPHTVVAAGDKEILFNVFEGFYKFNHEGKIEPALATDCAVSDDCKEFVFTLRQGVKFHNGEDMKMSDVLYSIKRAKENMKELAGIASYEADGDDKVKIVLEESNSAFLALCTFAIIPESVADINATPVGTGPFIFKNYMVGQSVTLTRNENYWNEELPFLDEVVFKICADMDSGLLELQNGSIDIFPHMTKDKADLAGDRFNLLSAPSNMVQIFALNNTTAPFDNEKVREAINIAIDRQEIINLTMDGEGVPLYTAMSPAMGDPYDKSLDGYFTQDIEKAKDLLKEAGYEDGLEFTISVPSNYLVHVNTAVAIADQLKAVGITAKIEEVDWNTWLEVIYTGRQYQSTVICLTSDYAPLDVIARYESDNPGNFINYNNPKIDELIQSIPTTMDETERNNIYHEIIKIIAEDSASCYIQDPMEITVVSRDFTDYMMYPMYIQDMSTVKKAAK